MKSYEYSWFTENPSDPGKRKRSPRVPHQKGGFPFFHRRYKKISIKDFVVMIKQMSAMMNAGLPIIDVLAILEENGGAAGALAREWHEGIMAGKKLAFVVRHSTIQLPPEFPSIIEAGEESGSLAKALRVYVTEIERQDKVDKKMKSALIYPSIVFGVVGIIITVMFGFALPRMEVVFTESGATMDGITSLVFGISHVILAIGFIKCLVASAILAFIIIFTPYGRRLMLKMFSIIPGVRNLDHASRWAMFLSVAGTSLSAGISLPDAMELAKHVSPKELKKRLPLIIDAIYQGRDITNPEIATWPGVVRGFLRSGMKSGNLPQAFLSAGQYFSEQAEDLADGLSKTLEPAILLFLVLAVAPVPIVMVKMMASMYMNMLPS